MRHHKPTDEIDELLWQCLEGTATDEQYKQAGEWVHHSQAHRDYYRKLRDTWLASELLHPVAQQQIDQAWDKMRQQIQPAKRFHIPQWIRAAVVLIVVFGLGMLTHLGLNKTGDTEVAGVYVIDAPKGSKSQITLPDGTSVWMNAGSKLTLKTDFGQRTREIQLQGEAFFEVAHSPQKPFTVSAAEIRVHALGTSFNVKAYPEENFIETTLVEGSVRIEGTHTAQHFAPVELKPHQTVTFYKKESPKEAIAEEATTLQPADNYTNRIDKIEIAERVNIEKHISWKDKRWVFDGEDLDSFTKKLGRRYDVEFFFSDEELKKYKLTGTLEEETIGELLDAIRLTIPMDYEIKQNIVYLRINQQLKTEYEKVTQQK